jgi:uncharacterized damage-inducible protein DinB
MNQADYFRQLYAYNRWANLRLLEACTALTPEQWRQAQGHSWNTIHAMLVHMLAAEWVWLSRWKGVSPRTLLDPAETPTLAAVAARWVEVDAELQRFVAAQTPESLDQEIDFTNTRGTPYRLRLWQMLTHVANHATHHRGELAGMQAALGVDHPEDDFYLFILSKSQP